MGRKVILKWQFKGVCYEDTGLTALVHDECFGEPSASTTRLPPRKTSLKEFVVLYND